MLEVHKFFGGDNFMDSFKGREKDNVALPDSDGSGHSAGTTNGVNGRHIDT